MQESKQLALLGWIPRAMTLPGYGSSVTIPDKKEKEKENPRSPPIVGMEIFGEIHGAVHDFPISANI